MIIGSCPICAAKERQYHERELLNRRELLEMRRRRCVRDMEALQKEIDEIDRQIEVIELRKAK